MNFIISFCCLLFLFHSVPSSSAEKNADQKNFDFLSQLISKTSQQVNLQEVVAGAFEKLGHAHNASILDSFFPEEEEEAIFNRLDRLEQCFSPKIKGGSEVKLFEEPLSSVVHKYIVVYWPAIEAILNDDQWLEKLEKKVSTLVDSIRAVARHVIACLKGLDDPNFEPTKLALNRFSMIVRKMSKFCVQFFKLIFLLLFSPSSHLRSSRRFDSHFRRRWENR